MNGTPVVSVIVPVYRQWDQLPGCLHALANQTFPSSGFEVIVVNNEASEKESIVMEGCSNVRLIHDPTPGSYAARNAGLEAARGKVIAFTDADCIPEADWIEQAMDVFEKHSELSRVAGLVVLTYRNPEHKTAVELYETLFAFQQKWKVQTQESAVTANLFVRQEVFERIGLFNPDLKSGGDTEWGKRAAAAGLSISYEPQVRVAHPARRTWMEIRAKSARLYGGRWDLSEKKHSRSRKLLNGIKLLKPSANMVRRIWSDRSLTFVQKCRVVLVLLFIQVVQCMEHFRLFFWSGTGIR